MVWCSPDHALAEKAVLRWRDLQGIDFYAAGRDHEHSVAPQFAGDPDASAVSPVQIVANVSTALGIAAANLGISCSPAYVRAFAEPFGLVMRRVVDPEVLRYMSLYTPIRRQLSAAAEHFRAFAEQRLSADAATEYC